VFRPELEHTRHLDAVSVQKARTVMGPAQWPSQDRQRQSARIRQAGCQCRNLRAELTHAPDCADREVGHRGPDTRHSRRPQCRRRASDPSAHGTREDTWSLIGLSVRPAQPVPPMRRMGSWQMDRWLGSASRGGRTSWKAKKSILVVESNLKLGAPVRRNNGPDRDWLGAYCPEGRRH
jgi:hypothetical protein